MLALDAWSGGERAEWRCLAKKHLVLLLAHWILTLAPCCDASAASGSCSRCSLHAARALQPPVVSAVKDGEFEGYEFWDEHDELLAQAWTEHGPRTAQLYDFGPSFEKAYIHRDLRRAAGEARAGRGEAAAQRLFTQVVPGVFASDRLFTDQFLEDLLTELEHIEGAGIPMRRPNGMNRYGVILDQVGLSDALKGLAAAYVRPLASMLFPELVTAVDAVEHYAFTVRYESGGDTELAKHGDASVVTMNICLGRPGWTGGELQFFDYEATGIYALPRGAAGAGAGNVTFRPGLTLLHRGQHKHQALPLHSGERTNAIVWLFGRDGVVRVAPYAEGERLTPSERWRAPPQQEPVEL